MGAWYLLRTPPLADVEHGGTMGNKLFRGGALKRAGAGAAMAWTAALLVGLTPASAAVSPAALWHMEETSGSVMRDSSGNHNGSLHSVQLGQPGSTGNGYGFTGSSEVIVPSAGDLNPGTGGNRDTYNAEVSSRTGEAEYKAELEREAAKEPKGLLARLLRAVRRVIWGA